jgi:hypothetical protein
MTNFSKYLKDNEELVEVVRQHPLVYLKPAAIALFFFLLPFFLMFLLFKWETIGLIIFFLLFIIGTILIIQLVVVYSNNALLITNKRIVHLRQNSLFDRHETEAGYGIIQEVSYRIKGAAQTLFRYGSIRIKLADSVKGLAINKIPGPRRIQQLILKIKSDINS